jgi:hypothetical protein
MKQREVKRITDAHIVSFATQFGQEIVANLEANAQNKALPAQLAKDYGASIRILDLTQANTLQAADPKEKQVLEAIDYALKNKQDMPELVQKINGGDSLVYFKAKKGGSLALWRVCLSKKGVIQAVSVKEIKKKTVE